jgi:hypothetical protein
MNILTQDSVDQFNEEGYLVFEGLFANAHNQEVKDAVDQLMEDRKDPDKDPIIMRYPELGEGWS